MEEYLKRYKEGTRFIGSLSTTAQTITRTLAAAARGICAMISPHPFVLGSTPDDVDVVVPRDRNKCRKQDPHMVPTRDAILQSDVFAGLYDSYVDHIPVEARHGPDFQACCEGLHNDDAGQQQAAMNWACRLLSTWREQFRLGATKAVELRMVHLMAFVLNDSQQSPPSERATVCRNLQSCIGALDGPEAAALAQKIAQCLDTAAASSRTESLDEALATADLPKLVQAFEACTGKSLHKDKLFQILDLFGKVELDLPRCLVSAQEDASAAVGAAADSLRFLDMVAADWYERLSIVTDLGRTTLEARLNACRELTHSALSLAAANHPVAHMSGAEKSTVTKPEVWAKVLKLSLAVDTFNNVKGQYYDGGPFPKDPSAVRDQVFEAASALLRAADATCKSSTDTVADRFAEELLFVVNAASKVSGGNVATGLNWFHDSGDPCTLEKFLPLAKQYSSRHTPGTSRMLAAKFQRVLGQIAIASKAIKFTIDEDLKARATFELDRNRATRMCVKLVKTFNKTLQLSVLRPILDKYVEELRPLAPLKDHVHSLLWSEFETTCSPGLVAETAEPSRPVSS